MLLVFSGEQVACDFAQVQAHRSSIPSDPGQEGEIGFLFLLFHLGASSSSSVRSSSVRLDALSARRRDG